MDRRLATPDSGSNYNFQDKLQRPSVPRSLFDLSHLHTTTLPDIGSLIPIALFETVPGDSFELSVNALLRVLPQVVPMYARQRLTVHAFYCRCGDLWNEFNTFMTRGYTGNEILRIPTLNAYNVAATSLPAAGEPLGYEHLLSYMIPALGNFSLTMSSLSGLGINALPFMMYSRIWRDYYCNKNYYINDRVLLPNVDDHYRLASDGSVISAGFTGDLPNTYDLASLRYRDFADDYFTSAFPSPQRGTAPTLSLGNISITNLFDVDMASEMSILWNTLSSSGVAALCSSPSSPNSTFTQSSLTATVAEQRNRDFITKLNNHVNPQATASSTITLNQIRELASAQAILEKMAKTDGSYGDFGLTFFGVVSKNAVDYRPIYIGGTYQPIVFSEVLQTTDSTTVPLGSYAGHGISVTQDGYIGRVDCDDFGYIMLLSSVVPDTYYSQGLDRLWSRSLQSDMYLPERSRLGMREILNKELYLTGNFAQDNDLFAYQNPYDEYRYVPNRISGKIADSANESFFPYTQSRYFTTLPSYSQSFATMKGNVRNDFLAAPTEVPYTAQFSIGCRAVRPIPYHPIPSTLGV
ncbi:major capsid protein [Tortoise microvirus 59]|nr:major capsid protein [Tortoise microvirus 59]